MSKNEVALLVYRPLKDKRADSSFDGNGNVGALVIKELLEKSGVSVDFCSTSTAKNYKVVLLSLTSSYDVVSYYKQVWNNKDFFNRKFKVVCGGFGLQNPVAIRNLVDYALFGRAEGVVEKLVASILSGEDYKHESIMRLPEIHSVNIRYADSLLDLDCYKETFQGCPHKCLFCNYSWSRRQIGNEFGYVQSSLTNNFGSSELTWKQMMQWPHKLGRARSAIDGFSERLRYAYGKPISNEEIIEGLNHRGSFDGNTVLMVYNIGNMPGETDDDRKELESVMLKADPKNRVLVVLHTTPFRPSPATPMQWAPASLYPSYHEYAGKFWCNRDNLQLCHSRGNESAFSHLITLIVERATPTADCDKLFHAVATNSKLNSLKSLDAVAAIRRGFDLSPFLREYELGKEPTWFLNTDKTKEQMYKIWSRRKIC